MKTIKRDHALLDVQKRLRNHNALQRYKTQKAEEVKEPEAYGIIMFRNGNIIKPKTKERYNTIRDEMVWQIKSCTVFSNNSNNI